jgi:hypothetical protein
MAKRCQCGKFAKVYAIDPAPNGWADYYCYVCAPSNWITEPLYVVVED